MAVLQQIADLLSTPGSCRCTASLSIALCCSSAEASTSGRAWEPCTTKQGTASALHGQPLRSFARDAEGADKSPAGPNRGSTLEERRKHRKAQRDLWRHAAAEAVQPASASSSASRGPGVQPQGPLWDQGAFSPGQIPAGASQEQAARQSAAQQQQTQSAAESSIQFEELRPGAVPPADTLVLWNEHLVPEALDDPRPAFMELLPRTGTRAVQEDFRELPQAPAWLLRPEIRQLLIRMVEAQQGTRTLLTGPTGAGTSTALAGMVQWARVQGWVALHIPSAKILTHGGFFPQVAEGSWDTPESAKAILTSLANHREDLEDMKLPDGSSAAATIQKGLDDAQGGLEATPAALAVLEHLLYHQDEVEVLVAVDSYEYLHLPSEYGEWLAHTRRRVIPPQELRLASALQLLSRSPGPSHRAHVVCVDSGARNKHYGQLPMSTSGPKVKRAQLDHMSLPQWDIVTSNYKAQGRMPVPLKDQQTQLLYWATSGNPRLAPNYSVMIQAAG